MSFVAKGKKKVQQNQRQTNTSHHPTKTISKNDTVPLKEIRSRVILFIGSYFHLWLWDFSFCSFFFFFLAPTRSSRRSCVERASEWSTVLCFYIQEFNVLVRRPWLSLGHSRHKPLSHAHTHTLSSITDSPPVSQIFSSCRHTLSSNSFSRTHTWLCNSYNVIFRIFRATHSSALRGHENLFFFLCPPWFYVD